MPETTTIRFRVQPGFATVTAIFAACGWSMHAIAAGGGHWSLGPVSFSAIFTVALLALIAVHEASHVVAGRLHGHRLIGVRIGSKFGVTMLGDHTPRSMLLTAATGPIVGSAAAAAVLAATDPWSPIWAAAVVALIENLANVGLFFLPGRDGSKIVAALKEMGRVADSPAWGTSAPRPVDTPVSLMAATPGASATRRAGSSSAGDEDARIALPRQMPLERDPVRTVSEDVQTPGTWLR